MAIEGFSQSVVGEQLIDVSKFKALAAEIAEDGFRHFVLLGTGGPILTAEIFGQVFGAPQLLTLDSTDPAQIQALRAKIEPERTLFCVSSPSGKTPETNLLLPYFFEETRQNGHHFIAVTQPGSPLEERARQFGFRQVFRENRVSALSDYGLVPHAAAGLDTERLLKQAAATNETGEELGLTLANAAKKSGRDKITLVCSRSLQSLGLWAEHLLAGLFIPVNSEPVLTPEQYGKDRLFVYMAAADDKDAELESKIVALEKAGEPVIRMLLKDSHDLGQLIVQWETAVAVAGTLLKANTFEQPEELALHGEPEAPFLERDGIQLFADQGNAGRLLSGGHRTLGGVIRSHLDRLKPGGYFGLLAYIPMFAEYEARLQRIRKEILEAKHVATVLGFGPRFQHGAGLAYKAGPNSGVFLQITCGDGDDLPVFSLAKAAQARVDFQLMAERQRRILRIHFAKDLAGGLDHLHDVVCAAVSH